MRIDRAKLPMAEIEAFCRRWKVRELALFGSALREDSGPDSDVDVLVDFADDAPWTLFHMARMEAELEGIFGREVDLLTRPGVEGCRDPFRRQTILSTAEVIYAA